MLLSNNHTILIAEDDDDDFLLIQEVLEEVEFLNPIVRVKDGEELIKHLANCQKKSENLPAFIFLDLNMPRKNGLEALREIKTNEKLRNIPVIILSTSNVSHDVLSSYDLGSNAYITKPSSYVSYVATMNKVMGFWKGINQF